MPYRGLPYFVSEQAGAGNRVDPYASERHALPDCAQGVRYSSAPRSDERRVTPYRACQTVCPPRARASRVDAQPALSDVEPLRILAAVMLMAVVAVVAAFVGIGVANGFTGIVDGAVLSIDSSNTASENVALSTAPSEWEQGTVPQLYQADYQWADRPYGSGTMGSAGAAPLSLAMVHACLTGDTATGPVEVASLAQRKGYADQPDATALLTDGAAEIGLTARPVEASELALRRQLNAGFPVICAVSSDAFGGHATYIVLCGIDEHSRLVVCDPGSVDRSEKRWSFDDVLSASTSMWAYGVAG
ncbi:hypothetical protein [Gordonibacter massiliensis (ex Traore et al. 2017)]|uniref:hypothetical protein n=1 Tax=Gordonibacter massiliensis (ex Traore et al. 2017) TaxID=1841863 RepID=UPI0009B0CB81|nr:hypothetical protein [Gordonibacter massiliensis (ex Traore et al. 2017)]MBX9034634.1 hypothetical protein [Gordonibacter massiliensis (ex Traore et al. 2017)]